MKQIQRVLVICALAVSAQVASSAVIQNGGFEDGFAHWISQGAVIAEEPPGDAHEGKYYASIPGGTLSQKVLIPNNGDYLLSFWYKSDTAFSLGFQSFGNEVVWSVSPSLAWKQESRLYKDLVAGEYILNIFGVGQNVDSFSMVPEPYHYGLASVLGLMGLVVVDRMRHRKLTT